jgi:NAD kinase
MASDTERKIILVVRETRLDDLVARFNTVQQAQFYIEHLGADFSDYLAEHNRYREAVGAAEASLRRLGRVQRLERRYLPNFIFGAEDLVVVLGQDGLVANTMKYLDGQRLVGVNPDPGRWDGALLPFTVGDLDRIVPDAFTGKRAVKVVTMAEVLLNTGQSLLAVNDFFIGRSSHVSARYRIAVGGREERHSSSGIIVSTGFGSTGWLKSIYAGLAAVARTIAEGRGGRSDGEAYDGHFAWDADQLHYFVREPYPSRITQAGIVIGLIHGKETLQVVSEMPENGVIFSDGIESDFVEFNSGTEALIGISGRQGMLVT